MNHPSGITLTFRSDEFRTLPIPTTDGRKLKLSTCFVPVEDLPSELEEWMEVNPRVPKRDRKAKLKGAVAKGIMTTLEDDPEKFALKNNGLFLLCDEVSWERKEGGEGNVTVTMTNPDRHGLVNGGHSFLAIRQVLSGRGGDEPTGGFVRLHLFTGLDPEMITDIAEGLNRSLQVDDPSLENLSGSFEEIKHILADKPGADQIAYHQGDSGEIDIQLVLTMMSMFDMDQFPDRKTHPNTLFGQQKRVLNTFIEDRKNGGKVFRKILPQLHEILVLSDRVQREAVKHLGKVKIADVRPAPRPGSKKGNRVASPNNKGRPAHFAGGTINGKVPLGWLYPMLAAFRANVSLDKWKSGKLEWLQEPEDLLKTVIGEMAAIVYQEHIDNRWKAAEVGKREAAYRLCYTTVALELAQRGISQ